jgi:hypothetical protein
MAGNVNDDEEYIKSDVKEGLQAEYESQKCAWESVVADDGDGDDDNESDEEPEEDEASDDNKMDESDDLQDKFVCASRVLFIVLLCCVRAEYKLLT